MKNKTMIIGLAIAIAAGTANAQFYRLGRDTGLSNSISNTGVVVGDNDSTGEYYIWDASNGVSHIGGAAAGGGIGGQPTISNDGMFIGGTVFNTAENWYEMGRYNVNSGSWAGVGRLPGIGISNGGSVGSGWAISGNGQHITGLAMTNQGIGDAYAATYDFNEGWTNHGTNAVGNSSRANGINNDGTVVAGWQEGDGRQGSVWNNGVQQLIISNQGTAAGEAYAVSDNGRYVSGLGDGGFFAPGQAYRYDVANDSFEALDQLASGAGRFMSGATISGDGSLIGGGTWGFGPALLGNGFIWSEDFGTLSVDQYFDSVGAEYDADFHFSFVSDISADGEWFTGWGYDTADGVGGTQAWVVHVPAPSSLAFVTLGAMSVTRRRRS